MSGRDWPWATLDEVATVTAGNPAPQGIEFFDGGSRPFVRVQDLGRLDGASHLTETADLVNDRAAATLKLFPRGSVLFTKSGASLLLNQRAILSRDMHVVSHIGVAVPGPRITSEWLYYWLRTVDFADISHGANMPSLPLARVKKVRVPVPPVSEQRRRVAELEKQSSRLDEAVANLKRVKANLRRQRAAILKAAVVGNLNSQREPTWPRALDAGDPLPDGWRWHRAEELAAPEQGSIGAGPFGTIFKAKDFRPEGVPIIFLRHVAPMKYLQHKPGFMDTRKWDELFRQYSVFGGELLITKLGEPPGACALYPAGIGPAMVTPDVIKMRVDESKAVPAYLMYYLNSDVARRFATGAAFGTTRTRLTLPLFRDTPVVVPPLDEQHCIVAEVDRRLSIVRHAEAEVDANLERSQGLRQAMLAKALSAEH